MVKNVSSLGRSGLHDWLIQRVSAVIIAAYTIYLLGCILCNMPLSFEAWQALFSGLFMKVFTLVCLVSLLLHAWIGLWTVTTDYLKHTAIRVTVQMAVILASFIFVIWGIQILWG